MERQNLIEKYGQPSEATNAIIIKINNDTFKNNMSGVIAAIWVLNWMGMADTTVPPSILKSKIQRVAKKATTLRKNALQKFLNEPFRLPDSYNIHPSTPSSSPSAPLSINPTPSTSSVISSPPSPPSTSTSSRSIRNTPTKAANVCQDRVVKYNRKISILQKKLKKLKDDLVAVGRKKSHYSVKNVNKRDERNVAIRTELRIGRNMYQRQAKKTEEENERLKRQLHLARSENSKMKRKMACQQRKLKVTMKGKRIAEKRAGCYRKRIMKRKEEDTSQGMVVDVANENEMLVKDTKSCDGQYTPETRLCVMDLLGLEVATGKIGEVMESVGKLANTRFSHLPSRQTCQKIADEGQVMAKAFIKEKIVGSGSFGLHKDGTSRRKVKILDTSVVTEDGDAYCLGWTSVSSETGKAIAEEGKEKLGELLEDDNEMMTLLERLKYTMSDRAANEKKSNKILEEWREEMLKKSGEENISISKIHHLFCLAHVLLGFQSYTINEIKKLEKFASTDFKHPVVLVLKDATDLFGPVGDYRGVKNQWDAFCMEKNIKSTIKSYKDNRFNGLFEVAAQVFHHHKSFLSLLQAQKSNNFKQTRLLKSLQNPDLILLLECLALFYHKVTGPFWSMTITKSIPLHLINFTFQKLERDLVKCTEDPHHIFSPDSFSFHNFKSCSSSQETLDSISKEMKEEMREIIIAISSALLSTVRKQLADFLAEGQYGSSSAHQTLEHLSFAPLSNLVCERNFGHLDSSQRRRPHSSLHHHTSVILLKQTRKNIKKWYDTLTLNKKKELWERARKKGQSLREKHRQQDKNAIMESLPVLRMAPELDLITSQEPLRPNQLIAVACQDNWYPALVQDACLPDNEVKVNFGSLGKELGVFKWPSGKDIHIVARRSIVSLDLDVQPRANGRMWVVKDAKDIQAKFKKFS